MKNKTIQNLASKTNLTYGKSQYIFMALGFVLMLVGLSLSVGGHNDDPNVFDPAVIYNPRITILAPMVMLAGLILEIYAIFKKNK